MKKRLYNYCTVALFILAFHAAWAQSKPGNSIYVAQWNVENLFDAIDDPVKNDTEFLPESDKFWTDAKLERKLINLAKVINFLNDGYGPDVIAFEEVENLGVLKKLAYKLKDRDFIAAHRESPDERGIDVGLLYDRKVFDVVSITPIKVTLPTKYATRDILHVKLIHKSTKQNFHFFVNHWPSRRGGEKKSEPNREAAATVLRKSIDSLYSKDANSIIIALGDFNDEPTNDSFTKILKAKDFECDSKKANTLLNLAYKKTEAGEGSYLFGGQWDMIDQIVISSSLLDNNGWEYVCDSFNVIKPEFMVINEGNRKGGAMPTYMGTLYIEGFSDHFPVGAKFYYKADN